MMRLFPLQKVHLRPEHQICPVLLDYFHLFTHRNRVHGHPVALRSLGHVLPFSRPHRRCRRCHLFQFRLEPWTQCAAKGQAAFMPLFVKVVFHVSFPARVTRGTIYPQSVGGGAVDGDASALPRAPEGVAAFAKRVARNLVFPHHGCRQVLGAVPHWHALGRSAAPFCVAVENAHCEIRWIKLGGGGKNEGMLRWRRKVSFKDGRVQVEIDCLVVW
ncbi:hypothetical protein QBC39DRAFT_357770 [Podospora conica]|nr:hypothetical protein QBC39DRAFT_357770 [Schizothecium conicum]